MTSSNENIFRVTGPSWGEFTGHRWIDITKASDVFFDVPEQTVEQTVDVLVIWDTIAPIMTSLYMHPQEPHWLSIYLHGTGVSKTGSNFTPHGACVI